MKIIDYFKTRDWKTIGYLTVILFIINKAIDWLLGVDTTVLSMSLPAEIIGAFLVSLLIVPKRPANS